MAASMRVVAAVGGIAVAFVFVMLVSALSPDPELETDEARVAFDRFALAPAALVATSGTVLVLENAGAVPVTLRITGPDGANGSVALEPGASSDLHLDRRGVHTVTCVEYPWASAEIEVRSANPFTRFFEDLF